MKVTQCYCGFMTQKYKSCDVMYVQSRVVRQY